MVHAYNDLPLQVREATYRGEKLATVFVVENDGELEAFATSGTESFEELQMPVGPSARAKLLVDWIAKAARKNKKGLVPVLLLPLAACGGSYTLNPFEVAETPTASGEWLIDSDNGAVILSAVDSNYVLTPATG